MVPLERMRVENKYASERIYDPTNSPLKVRIGLSMVFKISHDRPAFVLAGFDERCVSVSQTSYLLSNYEICLGALQQPWWNRASFPQRCAARCALSREMVITIELSATRCNSLILLEQYRHCALHAIACGTTTNETTNLYRPSQW